jgi:hypothetical protein
MIIAAECNNGLRCCFEVKRISYDAEKGISISTGLDFNKFAEKIIIDPKGDISYIIATDNGAKVANKVKECEISGNYLFRKCTDPENSSICGLEVEENATIEYFHNYTEGKALTVEHLYEKLKNKLK